jgi:hypothetical protein
MNHGKGSLAVKGRNVKNNSMLEYFNLPAYEDADSFTHFCAGNNRYFPHLPGACSF